MQKPYPLWLLPLLALHANGAGAFPPYRSTDADAAEPREFQLRLGPRTDDVEKGWRSSLLAEFPRGDARFGLELFARDAADRPIDIRAGAGVIYSFGATGIRSGLHAGLTRGAPDVSFNLWITRSFTF